MKTAIALWVGAGTCCYRKSIPAPIEVSTFALIERCGNYFPL